MIFLLTLGPLTDIGILLTKLELSNGGLPDVVLVPGLPDGGRVTTGPSGIYRHPLLTLTKRLSSSLIKAIVPAGLISDT